MYKKNSLSGKLKYCIGNFPSATPSPSTPIVSENVTRNIYIVSSGRNRALSFTLIGDVRCPFNYNIGRGWLRTVYPFRWVRNALVYMMSLFIPECERLQSFHHDMPAFRSRGGIFISKTEVNCQRGILSSLIFDEHNSGASLEMHLICWTIPRTGSITTINSERLTNTDYRKPPK